MSNRLASTNSLYLRKHADNPINWWYWSEEALAKAKKEDKPIFLSIGYSSCHWCTVMEGEAFSDRAIADYLNANFLPIKVDREERPDLDSIYMQCLQMMTGQGGWPLNVFLTPDRLIPFYGGTYFPVEPSYGRPSFLEVLRAVKRFYEVEKDKLSVFTAEVIDNLQQTATLKKDNSELSLDLLIRGVDTSMEVIIPVNTGRPSFPMIPYAQLALEGSKLQGRFRYNGQELAEQRGLDLALGGIYDIVGGGFHRYTVDSTWTVPHFEKMLYDNGQIMEYLADLWSAGIHQPAFAAAIAGTKNWLQREMTAPEGYFYASQDADSFADAVAAEPEEGAFYVWSYEELRNILTDDELAELKTEFTIEPEGNFEEKIVLQRLGREKLSDSLHKILDTLFTVRYGKPPEEITTFPLAKNNREAKSQNWQGRIPPVTDTKTIVAWNSLMISGLAKAYRVFQEEAYLEAATKAANFILQHQWVDGRFHRLNYDGQPSTLAQAEDYALFIKALLDLQSCVPTQTEWLDRAIEVQSEFDRLLWSEEEGGYYNSAKDRSQDLLVRERSYLDNATPAANGVAIANLVRLSMLAKNNDYLQQAERALQVFSGAMQQLPQACPSLFTALNWYLYGTSVETTAEYLERLIPQYLPTTVYYLGTDLPPGSVGLVCQKMTCLEPAQNWEQLLEQISPTQ